VLCGIARCLSRIPFEGEFVHVEKQYNILLEYSRNDFSPLDFSRKWRQNTGLRSRGTYVNGVRCGVEIKEGIDWLPKVRAQKYDNKVECAAGSGLL
jgi:hypothetical protein